MAVTIIDKQYQKIVSDIIESEEFNKLKDINHHGITRYEHSLKVSYRAYKIAKVLKLDYKATARGGLLHDFFISSNEKTHKESVKLTFTHPRIARDNAHYLFMTNIKEDDVKKIKDVLGKGNISIMLAQTGYDVTVVIGEDFE